MKSIVALVLILMAFIAKSQTNSFPLYSSGAYSGGTTSDLTNVTNAQLKLQSTSGYIRIPHLSAHATTSTIYNFEVGKNIYWGEDSDGGAYIFRGRNFGIGTGSPQAKLHVLTPFSNISLFETTSTGNSAITIKNAVTQLNVGIGSTGSTNGYTYLWAGNDKFMIGNDGNPTLVVNGMGNGNVGIGTVTSAGGKLQINANADANNALRLEVGGFSMGGSALFQIDAPGIGGGRFTVNNNGNVGIGTATPSATAKLEINLIAGTGGQNQGLKIWAGNSYNYFGNSQLQFSYGGGGGGYSHAIKSRHNSGAISGNAIDFYLWQPGDPVNGEGSLNVMTLHGGNVGIGTTAPQGRLEVLNSTALGTSATNSILLHRFSSSGNVNYFMNNTWLYRDANGSDWLTARMHNGISIDGSFLTPGVDTRTWWERAPFQDIQSFGTGSTTYLTIKAGNVGIGSLNPNQKLTVNGTIYGKEVKVDLSVPGPDYVFEKDYQLPSLEEIKTYIDQNKHLPEVPSTTEMEKNGVQLGEMNMLLLKKVEELTLYAIAMNAKMEKMKRENEERLERIQKEMKQLKKIE
jgi:hypothetical protein